ncbi:MAG TPA: bifunctional 4-hydroxy-2-oxoglutarate aldolase/2-dehydro-3-deoxy-phosphogluconate aldolase [Candidatus Angelobacter sp.]|jgi:2-dehydro-3-deoxyphosphogluconate aldolase/(4S)-4-hydroxy-2-oxoglutarate aldolase
MTSAQVRERILDIGIIPVVRASSAREAFLAVEAVAAGGIPIAELTMTVPGAIDLIADLARTVGADIVIGAGTVLDAETAQRCVDAGAEFIVSPGFDLETVKLARRLDMLVMAGALTPTEVITAWKAGCDFVKIFPCGNVGGAKYIKALKGPLPQVPMIPTGGVNLETAADFLRAGAAALGVGGELIVPAALKSGDGSEITRLAQRFLGAIAEVKRPMAAVAQPK